MDVDNEGKGGIKNDVLVLVWVIGCMLMLFIEMKMIWGRVGLEERFKSCFEGVKFKMLWDSLLELLGMMFVVSFEVRGEVLIGDIDLVLLVCRL